MVDVVYVVGGPKSPKTNQWLHMTADKAEAERLQAGIEGGTMKKVDVPPPRSRRKRSGKESS